MFVLRTRYTWLTSSKSKWSVVGEQRLYCWRVSVWPAQWWKSSRLTDRSHGGRLRPCVWCIDERKREREAREEALVIFDRSLVLIFIWPVASPALRNNQSDKPTACSALILNCVCVCLYLLYLGYWKPLIHLCVHLFIFATTTDSKSPLDISLKY